MAIQIIDTLTGINKKYPIVNSDEIKGGIHTINFGKLTYTDENEIISLLNEKIPENFRDTGMLVYVKGPNEYWKCTVTEIINTGNKKYSWEKLNFDNKNYNTNTQVTLYKHLDYKPLPPTGNIKWDTSTNLKLIYEGTDEWVIDPINLILPIWQTSCLISSNGNRSEWTTPIRITGESVISYNLYYRCNEELTDLIPKGIIQSTIRNTEASEDGIKYIIDNDNKTWTDHPLGVDLNNKYEYVCYPLDSNSGFTKAILFAKYGENGLNGTGLSFIFTKTNTKIYRNPAGNIIDCYNENNQLPDDGLKELTFLGPNQIYEGNVWFNKALEPDELNPYVYCQILKFENDEWSYQGNPVIWSLYVEGKRGFSGCVTRMFKNNVVNGKTYRNDSELESDRIKYLDYLIVKNENSLYEVYVCNKTHTVNDINASVETEYLGIETEFGNSETHNWWNKVERTDGSSFFESFTAITGYIKTLSSSGIIMMDEENGITGGFVNEGDVVIWSGGSSSVDDTEEQVTQSQENATFKVLKDGTLICTKGQFLGLSTNRITVLKGNLSDDNKGIVTNNNIFLTKCSSDDEGFNDLEPIIEDDDFKLDYNGNGGPLEIIPYVQGVYLYNIEKGGLNLLVLNLKQDVYIDLPSCYSYDYIYGERNFHCINNYLYNNEVLSVTQPYIVRGIYDVTGQSNQINYIAYCNSFIGQKFILTLIESSEYGVHIRGLEKCTNSYNFINNSFYDTDNPNKEKYYTIDFFLPFYTPEHLSTGDTGIKMSSYVFECVKELVYSDITTRKIHIIEKSHYNSNLYVIEYYLDNNKNILGSGYPPQGVEHSYYLVTMPSEQENHTTIPENCITFDNIPTNGLNENDFNDKLVLYTCRSQEILYWKLVSHEKNNHKFKYNLVLNSLGLISDTDIITPIDTRFKG